ncbi:MAG TPA: Tol-Pal system protein TolB, partial [Hyphomicrobiaceae bacterium]|nr:Tol-Pal system protein TolB [Hyphomicrobiaceae bacterium]
MSETAMRDRKMSRRQASALLLLSPLLPTALSRGAHAQQDTKGSSSGPLEIDITQGTLAPIPIAIPRFMGDDARFSSEVTGVVIGDLERSGLFKALDQTSFIDQVRDINSSPRFQDWRVINAQALVVGRAGRSQDGRYFVEFRLYDVLSQRELVAKRFASEAVDWRRLAHRVADQVYERLTGEKGYFDTQIVFVDETGPKERRRKRLAIMDQDGANVRLLSQGQELVLTPRFSPTSQEITYLQYIGDQPRVQLMNLDTGAHEMVGNFPGMTFAPRFSPDGQRIVMSIGEGGASALVEMDLRTRRTKRL